eukprot:COSAG01_NODE_152_length_23937_cov_122.193976_27_plen_84_part_00
MGDVRVGRASACSPRGTDFGDLYDAVHCFKRAQATLVDLWPPSGKPEVFGMGRGVTSIPFHDLVVHAWYYSNSHRFRHAPAPR